MKFQLALLCLLCATPVLLQPLAEEESGRKVAVGRGSRRFGDINAGITTSTTPSPVVRRPIKTPSPKKLTQSTKQTTNQLSHSKKKSAVDTKRRPANSKKGTKKTKVTPSSEPAIEYAERSSMTDQLNQIMDDTIVVYAQSVANKTFNLKIQNMALSLKIKPWAYLSHQSANKSLSKRETGAEDVKVEDEATEEEVIDPQEDVEGTTEMPSTTDAEPEAETEATIEAEEDEGTISSAGFIYSRTIQPLPIDGGRVQYQFKLLSQQDLASVAAVPTTQGKPVASDRQFQRTPKRPNAIVEGLDVIKRVGDVQVGVKNGTMRVFDVPIQMGPIRIDMKNSQDPQLKNSYVTSPLLTATLRITENEGQIVSSRISPAKIHSSDSVVTTLLSRTDAEPNAIDSARLVSHLSKEMARIWNSAYLLRRTGQQFTTILNANSTDSI